MCKHGDMFSLQILIGRSLFLLFIASNLAFEFIIMFESF